MTAIVDASSACGSRAKALLADGVGTVIRYYSRDTSHPAKQLTRAEAQLLVAAGLRLGAVYEGRAGNRASNFSRANGVAEARYARTYAATSIGQPAGSVIYFAVDFDAVAAQITTLLIPYFQGIADAWAQATGEPDYGVGVYGSGAVCQALLDAGLVRSTWLAQSKGWAGYKVFLASRQWTLSQQAARELGGVPCDPNLENPDLPFASFTLAVTPPPASGAITMYVNARSGLRLRSGPGTEFDSLRLLPFGTSVQPLKVVGNWTCVDLQGDGAADGFVSSAYLLDSPSAPVPSPSATPSGDDAVHVAELVRQGGDAQGLAAARATASASLAGYPTNGCAAHLSALLQQAGIDVPMTWGAGKLAHLLEARGWRRVAKSAQQPGDVGVCFDNTSPPGADHVYLVIEVLERGEMLIADNQNPKNAPHSRFQDGHGKTDTEYFLRAA